MLEVGSVDYYDKVWENEWFDMERFNPTARHLERMLSSEIAQLKDVKTLADVGCGMGVNVKRLNTDFPSIHITGTDISPKSLDLARRYVGQRPNVDYDVLNVETDALPRKFDLVLCSQVLEHIADDHRAIRNLAEMVNRYLLITVPGGKFNSTSKLVGHFRHYSKRQLIDLVNSAGNLKILKAYEWGFPFHSLYKFMLDQIPPEKQKAIGLGRYDLKKRLLSHVLYGLFFGNQFNRGANVILLAEKV